MNNDKPRLLIFHPALAPYRLDFFNALADRFTCHVVLLQRENPALFIKQDQLLAEARFTYAYLDRHFTLAGRDINLGYASAIRHFRPDIVLCSEFNLSVLSAALYRWRHPHRFRLFTMCDDSIAMAERCQGGRRRRRAALIRCLDGIVNISEETAAWFLRHTPARRTFSFPIIRAEQSFVCHRPTAARYVSTHHLAGMKVGLFVGRYVDVKNLPALIEAFRRVCERNAAAANYRLVLVGSGEQANDLKAQAAAAGLADRVIFPGAYTGQDLWAWYATADFLVLCSSSEAFGAVVNEALLGGCRAIVSTYAGARELIGRDNGKVFDALNAEDFYNTLQQAYASAAPTPAEAFERPSRMPISFTERIEALSRFLLSD